MIFNLRTCLATVLSAFPIPIARASGNWQDLEQLNEPFTPKIADSIQHTLACSPKKTESYLRTAINYDNIKAVNWLLDYANQSEDINRQMKRIISTQSIVEIRLSHMISDRCQRLKLSALEMKTLISNDSSIAVLDLGYLLGFTKATMILLDWKWKRVYNCSNSIAKVQDKIIDHTFNINDIYDDGNTLLHIACIHNRSEVVAMLLRNPRLDINIENEDGYAAILVASDWNNWDIVKALLARKELNVGAKDSYGNTILHIACSNKQLDVVKILVSNPKVDINLKSKWKRTAIIKASTQGYWNIVNVLLSRQDLDLNAQDNDGNTLLHIACREGKLEIVKHLLARKAESMLLITNGDGGMRSEQDTAYDQAFFLDPLDASIKNDLGYTPLHYACMSGNLGVANFLLDEHLDLNMDITCRDKVGLTPIELAIRSKNLELIKLLFSHQSCNLDKDLAERIFFLALSNELVEVARVLVWDKKIELKNLDMHMLKNQFKREAKPSKMKLDFLLDTIEYFLKLNAAKLNDIIDFLPYESLLDSKLMAFDIGERLAKIFEANGKCLLQPERKEKTFLEFQRCMFRQAIRYLVGEIEITRQDSFEEQRALFSTKDESGIISKYKYAMVTQKLRDYAIGAPSAKPEPDSPKLAETTSQVLDTIFRYIPLDSKMELVSKLMEANMFLQGPNNFLWDKAERDWWNNRYITHYPWIWFKLSESRPYLFSGMIEPKFMEREEEKRGGKDRVKRNLINL